MENWKYKVILFLVICTLLISYPFFAIDYFETFTALRLTTKYFLVPIIICLSMLLPTFYFKKVKPLDNDMPKSKTKEKIRDGISIIMMFFCLTVIFFGIIFSLIITTNKFVGKTETIKIKQIVEKYKAYTTKNGRLRHYIDFENPKNKDIIHLEVYRKYEVGEIFEKSMKYGVWGILYSTE
jgi:amino acid transporter